MRTSFSLSVAALTALLLSGCSLLGPDEPVRDDESGAITQAADADAFSVRVGDCLTLLGSEAEDATEVDSLPTVPCGEGHDSEVYLAEQLTEAEYPGEEATGVMADELCYGAFEGFVGMAYEDSALDFTTLFPTQQSWDEMEDREILCIVVDAEGGVTGSLEGVAR